MPAAEAVLVETDCHKNRDACNADLQQSTVENAFLIFSAIKRAVALSMKKENWWHHRELCPATPFIKKLIGLQNSKTVSSNDFNRLPLEINYTRGIN